MSIFTTEDVQHLFPILEKQLEEIFKAFSLEQFNSGGYFSKKQTCMHLGISLSCLNNYLRDGVIKKYKIGGRVLIKKNELELAIK